MPHASHRIDLLVLPVDPDQPINEGAVAGLFEVWGLDERGRCRAMDQLIEGGCGRIWIDRPSRVWLYGNQSGGFRVHCPVTKENIAGPFGVAHRTWKNGGSRTMQCPSCGDVHRLEDVIFRPPAAFARWALVFSNAASVVLPPSTSAQINAALGETQYIIRRP